MNYKLEDLLKEDLRFYVGSVYKNCSDGDTRCQVRILPIMVNWPEEKLNLLPCFPTLFKSKVFRGYCEEEDGPNKASKVLILSNSDFSQGFVVDEISNISSNFEEVPSLNTYDFDNISGFFSGRGLDISNFQYKNMVIDAISSGKEGGYIKCHNFRTGDEYYMNASGTYYAFTQREIKMGVGKPSDGTEATITSFFDMTADEISMKAKNISIDGTQKLSLGHHGLNLCAFGGKVPKMVDGMLIVPINNIKC